MAICTPPDRGLYEVVTVDQCYSKAIPVRCDPGFMVRVLSAHHRQTEKCKAGFQDTGCVKEEKGNPACVGNTTCVFTTPWMYLSATCGYSNNFQIAYQCVPGKQIYYKLSNRRHTVLKAWKMFKMKATFYIGINIKKQWVLVFV